LPALFEAALTNKKKEQKGIAKELIHYTNDLLMISIGYTIPKTIEYLVVIYSYPNQAQNQVFGLLLNILFSLIVSISIPFMVSYTKIIEKMFWSDQKKKAKWRSFFMYVISFVVIIVSLILGV